MYDYLTTTKEGKKNLRELFIAVTLVWAAPWVIQFTLGANYL